MNTQTRKKTTIIEFLDTEPIENVVTCLNYRVDKVIFLGYKEDIKREREKTSGSSTVKFLNIVCEVETVKFKEIPKYDLQDMISIIEEIVKEEREDPDNQVFFDVTGGKELMMIAFGILSKRIDTPMHLYDIRTGRLTEFDEGAKDSISEQGTAQKRKLTLEAMIRLNGGLIHFHASKIKMDVLQGAGKELIISLLKYHCENPGGWMDYVSFISGTKYRVESRPRERVIPIADIKGLGEDYFNKTCRFLLDKGVLYKCEKTASGDKIRLGFSSDEAMALVSYTDVSKGGDLLELYEFSRLREQREKNMLGVHLDWDGVIQEKTDEDVRNEIDGLALDGYTLEFVSCKMGADKVHEQALYELDAIASRFGGKYAKKVLSVTRRASRENVERARELGIEIHYVADDWEGKR